MASKNEKVFPAGVSRRDKRIVLQERGRKYTLINESMAEVVETHVDGDLYTASDSTARCDYALFSKEFETAVLVELKGVDVDRAIEQISATIGDFSSKYSFGKYYGRIVSSKNNPIALRSNGWKKLSGICKRSGGNLKSGSVQLFDSLNADFTL